MALKNTWADGDLFAAADENAVATQVNTNTTNIPALNGAGLWSARPAAGNLGRVYFATDNGNTYRDNGTSWDMVSLAGTGVAGTEPPTTGWTTTTMGAATIVTDKGDRLLTAPSVSGFNLRAEIRPLTPASNYTYTAYVEYSAFIANTLFAGLTLRNSVSGSLITYGPAVDSATAAGLFLRSTRWSSPVGPSSNYGAQTLNLFSSAMMPKWLRIRDDGTTRFFEFSFNGMDWLLHASSVRTDFITPDQIGWHSDNNNSTKTTFVRLRSFNVTTP